MCDSGRYDSEQSFGLKSSGAKADLVTRLGEFYDDLTFEERTTKDEREGWSSDYVALAGRAYAELRAKKVITKDLDIEHQFEARGPLQIDSGNISWKPLDVSFKVPYFARV